MLWMVVSRSVVIIRVAILHSVWFDVLVQGVCVDAVVVIAEKKKFIPNKVSEGIKNKKYDI